MIEEAIAFEFDKGINSIDTNEMGEVIDMYKDLMKAKKDYYESKYYMQIVEAMEEYDEGEDSEHRYYGGRGRSRMRDSKGRYISRRGYKEMFPMYDDHSWTIDRDMDREEHGRMYYTEPKHETPHQRDMREGSSGIARKGYVEAKQLNKPESDTKMELETYMRELGSDMTEIINKATPGEKTMLKQKLMELANRVV